MNLFTRCLPAIHLLLSTLLLSLVVNEGALAANGARGLANFVVGSSVVAHVHCDKMNRKNNNKNKIHSI